MRNVISRTCNICQTYMTGGLAGFTKHGEVFHPNYFFSCGNLEKNSAAKFLIKKYYQPDLNRWFAGRRAMSRALVKAGISQEYHYVTHAKEFMREEYETNTNHPVLGDMPNKPYCGYCGKAVRFDGMYHYLSFCCFRCSTKWYAENTDRCDRAMATNALRIAENPDHNLRPNQFRYWIVRGYNDKDAEKAVLIRQTTFNLGICIAKLGEVEGLARWLLRQETWLTSLKKSGIYAGVSKISEKLFDALQVFYPNILYGNDEKIIRLDGRAKRVDCFDASSRKIIEFHGDYWHGNPKLYDETQMIKGGKDKISIVDKWEFDANREKALRDLGYDVYIVWENDYRTMPEQTLQNCKDFMESKPITIEESNPLFIWPN